MKKTKKTKILYELNSILDVLRWTSSQFNASEIYYGHGTDNVWDETLHLILPTLHLPIKLPEIIYNAHLTKNEKILILNKIKKRIKKRIPVPYLTNKAWFCGIEFYVNEHVFIPRSPIAELIQSHFNDLLPNTPHHILDMCTGSGCIAIATALNFPNSQVDAVDISKNALQIAKFNIKSHNLEDRVIPIYSNLFNNLPILKYDLILTNPPYVNETDIYNLPKEFHKEPKLALCAGNNELNIIKKILYNADTYLKHQGILICEVGYAKKKLETKYPNIPFCWIPLKNGGEGIFMLTYDQLITNKIFFKYK